VSKAHQVPPHGRADYGLRLGLSATGRGATERGGEIAPADRTAGGQQRENRDAHTIGTGQGLGESLGQRFQSPVRQPAGARRRWHQGRARAHDATVAR
jgi:hypothetical protein